MESWIRVFMRDALSSFVLLRVLLRKLPLFICNVRTQQEGDYEPGSELSLETESVRVLIFGFPVSRAMRKKCFLFKPPNHGIFVLVLNGLRHVGRGQRQKIINLVLAILFPRFKCLPDLDMEIFCGKLNIWV